MHAQQQELNVVNVYRILVRKPCASTTPATGVCRWQFSKHTHITVPDKEVYGR